MDMGEKTAPIRHAIADLSAIVSVNPWKMFTSFNWALFCNAGTPMVTKRRLRTLMGRRMARKGSRQLLKLAKLMARLMKIEDAGILIIIHPMAFARSSLWRCSAVIDIVIGMMRATPIPLREKKRSRLLKLVETAHATAESVWSSRPVINNRLWLNLTLIAPTMKDATSATRELAALICPTMPTSRPKVKPISIRRRDRRAVGGCVVNRDKNSDGRKDFPILCPIGVVSLLMLFTSYVCLRFCT